MPAQQKRAASEAAGRDRAALIAWTAAPLVLAAAATVSFSLRATFPSFEVLLFGGGLVFALASIVLQVLKALRDRKKLSDGSDEANAVRVATTEALQQLIDDLAEQPGLLPGKQKQFLRTISEAAAGALLTLVVTSVPKARVNVFHLEANGTKLVSRGKAGRGARSNAFLKSSAEGSDAIEFAAAGKVRIWPDLSVDAPTHWTPRDPIGYQTFIAAPICAGDAHGTGYSVYGMITVDAPVAGSLTLVEQHAVTLVADLVAIAFAIAEYSQPGATRS